MTTTMEFVLMGLGDNPDGRQRQAHSEAWCTHITEPGTERPPTRDTYRQHAGGLKIKVV